MAGGVLAVLALLTIARVAVGAPRTQATEP